VSETSPSTVAILAGAPATPSIGWSTTKPVRAVRKSVTASPLAVKSSLPALEPVITAE
jgi:hypothetical protein